MTELTHHVVELTRIALGLIGAVASFVALVDLAHDRRATELVAVLEVIRRRRISEQLRAAGHLWLTGTGLIAFYAAIPPETFFSERHYLVEHITLIVLGVIMVWQTWRER